MLSVCVPVYNTDVGVLARELSQQASGPGIPVEIIIADDASLPDFKQVNQSIRDLPCLQYIELEKNLGRSAIRNFLAGQAKYEWILFLDGDSYIPDPQFLRRYLDHANGSTVVCGGTLYQTGCPEPGQRLRWVYGRKREQISPALRSRKGFAITANNFMVLRKVLLQHPFREEIRDYGHEDTVLGYDLFKAGHVITHINNPVVHTGLESSGEFLEKTRKALENLLYISQNILKDPVFDRHSGLLKARLLLKAAGLLPVAGWLFRKFRKKAEQNLKGQKPRLWIFDLYRLGTLCTLA